VHNPEHILVQVRRRRRRCRLPQRARTTPTAHGSGHTSPSSRSLVMMPSRVPGTISLRRPRQLEHDALAGGDGAGPHDHCARCVAEYAPCSLGLSATSQQYFSLTTNQPPTTSHQPNEQADGLADEVPDVGHRGGPAARAGSPRSTPPMTNQRRSQSKI
jgi:hypothetical protein